MRTVDFFDQSGDPVGSVTLTDVGELRPDLLLESVTEAWLGQKHSPAEFPRHYDGWSNGYMTARIRDEQENANVTTTPKLGSGARFKKLAANLAAKGASEPDALAVSNDQPKYGAKKFGRLAAKAARSQKSK